MSTKSVLTYIVILAALFCFAKSSLAMEYYVSPSSENTSWNTCTNITTPCKATAAIVNAVADDIVYFRGGIYDIAGILGSVVLFYDFESVRLQPANSGSSGHPITFKAYPGEMPVFNDTTSGHIQNNFIIGGVGVNYIIWDGFTLKTNRGADPAAAQYFNGSVATRGNQFLNLTIDGGTYYAGEGTPQIHAMFIKYQNDFLIRGCRIFNMQSGGSNGNSAGIVLYHNTGGTIENCEIYNGNVGIYDKSYSNDLTVRNNYLHDLIYIGQGIRLETSGGACSGNRYYNNVIANCAGKSVFAGDVGGNYSGSFYNNTLYSNVATHTTHFNAQAYFTWDIYNNIFEGVGSPDFRKHTNGAMVAMDHNQWGTGVFRIEYDSYTPITSLVAWQSSGLLANGGNPGAGDLVSDPFIMADGARDALSEFQIGDSCIGAGRNGGNIGADVALVGIQTGGDTTAPAIPLGVSVR